MTQPPQRLPVLGNLVADDLVFADTATVQSISYDTNAQTALATNTLRKGCFFENDSDRVCYLKFGAGVSTSSYSKKLHPQDADLIGGFLNMNDAQRSYTGPITVLWAAGGSGSLRITELT